MKKIITLLLIISIIYSISCKQNNNTDKTDLSKSQSIRVAYMPDFSGTSSIAIAQENGYFKDENLEVILVKFLDGISEIDAMLKGDIKIAYIGHGAHYLAVQGKVNVLFPNGLSKSEQIIVRKSSGINDILDLKGKNIATTFGTSTEILLDLALKTSGINREDVNVTNMNGPNIVASMVNNKIDGTSVQAPYTFEIIKELGDEVKTIATISDYSNKGAFPSSWIVTPEYLKDNSDTVNRFSRAILRAMDYRAANMNEAIQIVSKFNNKTTEEVELEKETGIWLSGEDIKNSYNDGTASRWYKLQQDIFIYTKTIPDGTNINSYVQIKYMLDNILNK